MLLLHVLIPMGHLQGGYLQKSTFITHAVKCVCVCVCVCVYIKLKSMLLIKILLKYVKCRLITGILRFFIFSCRQTLLPLVAYSV